MAVRPLFGIVAAALTVLAASPARADEFVDRVNNWYQSIKPEKRSDLVLLPALAKMEPPPAGCAEPRLAVLLPAGSSGWSAAEAWANAAPQRAVLEALDKATQGESGSEGFAFGQPYGADALAASPGGIDLIKANLYTDLGDPPMLAGAKFQYLPALDRAACLVNVEATRLAAAGKPQEAIGVLRDWLMFARQMADREFFQEAQWGLWGMIVTLDRMRDVAYVDQRSGKHALTAQQLTEMNDRLESQGTGLRLDRLVFPMGNKTAAEQVVASVFDKNGGPSANFGQTMARLASTQRPLRLFAEAARWDKIGTVHVPGPTTLVQLNGVYNDLAARWAWDPWDQRLRLSSDYEKLTTEPRATLFAVLPAVLPDMTSLTTRRQVLRTQVIGTRDALAVLAFAADSKNFPPTLAALRPRYVKSLEADPFNPDRLNGKQPPLEYFVPMRDRARPSDEAKPHEMNVVLGSGENFQVRLGSDQFVLYSVGPDGTRGYAQNVSADPTKGQIGDLLLWPPVISLVRQWQVDAGSLK